MKRRPHYLRSGLCAGLAALVLWAAPAQAQNAQGGQPGASSPRGNLGPVSKWLMNRFRGESPAGKYERRHLSVVSAFREVVADPANSTVEVLCDHEPVALGAIVAANGYIITKASDLSGDIVCKLRDNRRYEAERVGLDKKNDLALLKIEADGLTPVVWTDQSEIPVGSWLATPGLEDDPLSIGVLSASARLIAAPRPILGVLLAQDEKGARIDEVMPGSGAEQAHLQVGDIICGVNDEEIKTRESLIQRIGQFESGDSVKLMIRRGEEALKIEALLGPLPEEGDISRHEFQNQLGSELSRRRAGFPSVFQHDTILRANECGGPIVDLNGHTVGINIARAGRVASYAVPASVVKQALASLMTAKPVTVEPSAMH